MSDYYNRFTFLILLLTSFLLGAVSECEAQNYAVTVTAGALDRSGTIASFHFPGEVRPGVYRMESEEGESVYLQVDNNNEGRFIIEDLKAGSSRTYNMVVEENLDSPSVAGVESSSDQNTITFRSEGNDVLSYFHGMNNPPAELDERYRRGGYIHPVYSPGGVVLTNHLDTEMHPHHYGIWSAWTSTRFQGRTPDFWNVQDNTGRVDHGDSLEIAWDGPVHGGLRAKNYFVDLSASAPVVALNEEWEITVYDKTAGNDQYHIFDLKATHTANTAQPLVLAEYNYGGVAFRGHENWNDPENVSFLTSEGNDRSNGNETRARWSHMGGIVDGERAGIAVLGHPDNYRSPQPVRIHPGIAYFVYSPMQLGEMIIEPGSPYTVRYRYVTYDGEPDPDELNRLWNDYAYPPGVTVVAR